MILAARIKPYFLREGLAVDDAKLLKIIPLIRERLVTLDDCLPFAAWFFKETVEPKPADLVAKNLTAAQSADIARQGLCIILDDATQNYPGDRLSRPCALLVRATRPQPEPGLWHSARRGDRPDRQPAAVRKHGNSGKGKGAGTGEERD